MISSTRSHGHCDDRHRVDVAAAAAAVVWRTLLKFKAHALHLQYHHTNRSNATERRWSNKRWPKPIYKGIIHAPKRNSINFGAFSLEQIKNCSSNFCFYSHFKTNYRLFVLIIRIKYGRKFDYLLVLQYLHCAPSTAHTHIQFTFRPKNGKSSKWRWMVESFAANRANRNVI